jgi:hypothetical protein
LLLPYIGIRKDRKFLQPPGRKINKFWLINVERNILELQGSEEEEYGTLCEKLIKRK